MPKLKKNKLIYKDINVLKFKYYSIFGFNLNILIMKKLIYTFMFTILLFSCETSNDLIVTTNINLVKITETKQLSGWEQREYFINLTYEEKAYLWQERMDLLLSTQNLNKKQIELINHLKKSIVPDIYKDDDNTFELNIISIMDEIKENFSRDEIISYFTTLNGTPSKSGTDNCECNKADDWCPTGQQYCGPGECESHSQGCGFFWMRACNGVCIVHQQ